MKQPNAHLAVIAANLFFGINFSAVQYITKQQVQPFALNIIRVAVSVILLWCLILASGTKPGIEKKHWPRFILCALTGVVINQSLFIQGLSMTLSIHASLLILVTPIFITFIAAWMGLENLTILKILGLVLGIAGAVMLAVDKENTGNGSNILWGDIFIIINAISYALYFILVKPLMKAYNPVHVIRWVFTIGLPITVLIGWNQFSSIPWIQFGMQEFAVLGFIVVFATFLAYLFNLYGVHQLGSSITGYYIYTQPVFAAIIAVLLLGERYTMYKTIAAGLIAGGVWLVSKKNKDLM